MKLFMFAQTTPEWYAVRRGVPTASCFNKIITPAKRGYSASARKYMHELIAQLTDPSPAWLSNRGGPYRSTAIQHGIDTEPEARRWYAMSQDVDVQQVGFCLTDDGRFGCSPDGLVGEDGGLELKCPDLSTHIGYLDDAVVPLEYLPQVHGSLIVTGRKFWDFMSYAPGADPLLIRVTPNDFTEALRKHLEAFWDEYQVLLKRVAPSALAPRQEPVAEPDPRETVPSWLDAFPSVPAVERDGSFDCTYPWPGEDPVAAEQHSDD